MRHYFTFLMSVFFLLYTSSYAATTRVTTPPNTSTVPSHTVGPSGTSYPMQPITKVCPTIKQPCPVFSTKHCYKKGCLRTWSPSQNCYQTLCTCKVVKCST